MKPIKILVSLLLVTALGGIFLPSAGSAAPPGGPLYSLYPPQNFTGTPIECNAYLTWQKPQMPNGTVPAGLIGYYLYRDGDLIHYIQSGDTLFYYDYNLWSDTFNYSLEANYDLSYYGLPGQFGQSQPAFCTVTENCCLCFPFYEPWDQGTFTFQTWTFSPSQSNWKINTGLGNPAPASLFTGTPAIQGYDATLQSIPMHTSSWVCANMYFAFDYKLADVAQGGTEKLIPEYRIDNTWYPIQEIVNQGSSGWIHQVYDISQVTGKKIRIGFRAVGQNSANIESWQIDNIHVYAICKGPSNSSFAQNGKMVYLSWGPPPCDSLQYIAGYNVYRTDQSGMPPYVRLNTQLLPGLEYTDTLSPSVTHGDFRYYITVEQKNPQDYSILCEAPGDTLLVSYSLGMDETGASGLRLYPQPADDHLSVQSDSPVEHITLYNSVGRPVLTFFPGKQDKAVIPVSNLPSGIYMVRVVCEAGTFDRKATIIH